MQEEIEHKTVNLAVQATKVTVRMLARALAEWRADNKRQKEIQRSGGKKVNGKQTVRQLIGQDKGVSSVEFADKGIKDFKRIANKFGVDFAVVKNKECDPPRYTVFFKARDKAAIDEVLAEYGIRREKRKKHAEEHPSILQKLKKFIKQAADTPHKEKEKKKEQQR